MDSLQVKSFVLAWALKQVQDFCKEDGVLFEEHTCLSEQEKIPDWGTLLARIKIDNLIWLEGTKVIFYSKDRASDEDRLVENILLDAAGVQEETSSKYESIAASLLMVFLRLALLECERKNPPTGDSEDANSFEEAHREDPNTNEYLGTSLWS
eukprot:scaffold220_cov169-Amphora_coffeaeformis.AAC.12